MPTAILLLQISVLVVAVLWARRHATALRAHSRRRESELIADVDAVLARIDDACLRLDARVARAEDVLERLRAARGGDGMPASTGQAFADPAQETFARACAALVQNPRKRNSD